MLGEADFDLVRIVLFVEDLKFLVIAEPALTGLPSFTSSSSMEGNGLVTAEPFLASLTSLTSSSLGLVTAEPFLASLTSLTSSSLIEDNGLACVVPRTEAEWGTKEEQPSSVGGREVALFEDLNCMVIAKPSLFGSTSISSSSSLTEGNPLVTAKPFLLGLSFLPRIEGSSSLLALLRRGLVCSLSSFSPSGSNFRFWPNRARPMGDNSRSANVVASMTFDKAINFASLDEIVSSQLHSTGYSTSVPQFGTARVDRSIQRSFLGLFRRCSISPGSALSVSYRSMDSTIASRLPERPRLCITYIYTGS